MELKLDADGWRTRPGMARLLDALGAGEGQTRYVGGAVRDELLGLPGSDIDLATRLLPAEVQRRLVAAGIKAVPTGIEHGTVTAVSDGQVVEVTTLRHDVSTDGRRATVAFTDDWAADAARRDFTINALFADPQSGEIFDYFGGLEDLQQRRVRFIGDPLQRIAEDHLRILRFFRFHARFGTGAPDRSALEACVARANDLMALSRERIADELLKLLALKNPAPTIRLMVERGLFVPVLPEIDGSGVARLDALQRVEQAVPLAPDPIRRLAALLPRDPEGGARVAARLRLSRIRQKRIESALQPARGSPQELAYRLGIEGAVDRIALSPDLAAAHGDSLRALPHWPVPKLPFGGGELIARGVRQGPDVARTLRRVEDAWIAAGFPQGEALERIVSSVLADQ